MLTPITTWSHAFSRASPRQRLFALTPHRFIVLLDLTFVVIGHWNYFRFRFTRRILKPHSHVLLLWILTVRISITLFKTATLSSKFGNSSILLSNQTVILFVWWIIFSRFGEVRCFRSSFVHTLPTSSEGRTALKANDAWISSFRNSYAIKSDCFTDNNEPTKWRLWKIVH